MRDFNQQLKTYSEEMKNSRCPYSEAELDKEIRSVIWNTPRNESKKAPTKRRIWPAIAAIVAFIIIPTIIITSKGSVTNKIASVEVEGQHIYFACNNGCTPEGTLQNFKAIIQ